MRTYLLQSVTLLLYIPFADMSQKTTLPKSSENEISEAFNKVIMPKKRNIEDLYKNTKKKKRLATKDEEFYIPYSAPDKHTEDGYVYKSIYIFVLRIYIYV